MRVITLARKTLDGKSVGHDHDDDVPELNELITDSDGDIWRRVE